MQLTERIDALRAELHLARAAGHTVGFVPTMGYLHEGHASLIQAAGSECDVVVASIFVNPLQFSPSEDFASYPRNLERDRRLAAQWGIDVLFVPELKEMYPEPVRTAVEVAGVSETLEGSVRPGHFRGVATVVAKLFNIVGPCRAYLGEKDYQQLLVVRRLVTDLSFPVEVVGCPTARAPDGLAISSRNSYLSAQERQAATVISRALVAGVAAIETGEREPNVVRQLMASVVASEPLARLDYAEVVDAQTLSVPARLAGELRLLVAARIGRTRLIDNMGLDVGLLAQDKDTYSD